MLRCIRMLVQLGGWCAAYPYRQIMPQQAQQARRPNEAHLAHSSRGAVQHLC